MKNKIVILALLLVSCILLSLVYGEVEQEKEATRNIEKAVFVKTKKDIESDIKNIKATKIGSEKPKTGQGSLPIDSKSSPPPPVKIRNPSSMSHPLKPILEKDQLVSRLGSSNKSAKDDQGMTPLDESPLLSSSTPLFPLSGVRNNPYGPNPIGSAMDPYVPGPHNGWGYYNEFNYPTRLDRPRAFSVNSAEVIEHALVPLVLLVTILTLMFS